MPDCFLSTQLVHRLLEETPRKWRPRFVSGGRPNYLPEKPEPRWEEGSSTVEEGMIGAGVGRRELVKHCVLPLDLRPTSFRSVVSPDNSTNSLDRPEKEVLYLSDRSGHLVCVRSVIFK